MSVQALRRLVDSNLHLFNITQPVTVEICELNDNVFATTLGHTIKFNRSKLPKILNEPDCETVKHELIHVELYEQGINETEANGHGPHFIKRAKELGVS